MIIRTERTGFEWLYSIYYIRPERGPKMAEKDSNVSSSGRKKKLPSMEELIEQGKQLLGDPKRKRKPVHYEFSTDPTTGRRNCKNTYSPGKYSTAGRKNRLTVDPGEATITIHDCDYGNTCFYLC